MPHIRKQTGPLRESITSLQELKNIIEPNRPIIILHDYSDNTLDDSFKDHPEYEVYDITLFNFKEFLLRIAINDDSSDKGTKQYLLQFTGIAYFNGPLPNVPTSTRKRTILDGPIIRYFTTFEEFLQFCKNHSGI